jgi:signal transduction histidine kinase
MFFSLESVYQPYSANDLLAVIFLIQAMLFGHAFRKTQERFFANLAVAAVMGALAWGTTRMQMPGKPYLDWNWFWAQPFFAGFLGFSCAAMLQYLPLKDTVRRKLMWVVVLPQVIYLISGWIILFSHIEVLRLSIILIQMPTIFAAGISAIACERRDPKMGHFFIGLAILSVPAITIAVALSGATTVVLRFWTGIPAVLLTQIMLMASLLRDRQQLRAEVIQRKEAETTLEHAKRSLDLKVQERTAELKGVIHALESFNRNVSHDLRGPLGGIDMLAFGARKQLELGDVKAVSHSLQQINDQVRESQTTINTMLLLARTYGKEIQITEINLSDLVRSAAREAYLSLSSGTQSREMPEIVIGDLGFFNSDASLIRVIFVNLITNSLKFNAGRSDVTIEIARDHQEEDLLALVIQDNGIGFDSETASNIFGAFTRFTNSIHKPGFGLGLNIVKLAVERLKGKVNVNANHNKGAFFKITLPNPDKRIDLDQA